MPRTLQYFFIGDNVRQSLLGGKEGVKALLTTLIQQLATPKPTEDPEEPRTKETTSISWDPLTSTTSGRRTITEEGSIPGEGYGSKTTDVLSSNVTWEKEEQHPAEAVTRFQEKESTPPYDNNKDRPMTPQRDIPLDGKTGPYQTYEDPWYNRGRRWQISDRRSSSPYGRSLLLWNGNRYRREPSKDSYDPMGLRKHDISHFVEGEVLQRFRNPLPSRREIEEYREYSETRALQEKLKDFTTWLAANTEGWYDGAPRAQVLSNWDSCIMGYCRQVRVRNSILQYEMATRAFRGRAQR